MAEYRTFDDEVTLVKRLGVTYDDYGNPIEEERERTVLCNRLSMPRNEFYMASQSGLKASYILSVHAFEYDNEEKVKYHGETFEVLRVFDDSDILELTVGEKIGTV